MNKTIKQAERYEAPSSMVINLLVQKCIALSGGTEQMEEESENNW